MKKVCILTQFSDYQKAYSLNIVAKNQIKQLLLNGYSPTVIVQETFEPQDIYADPRVKLERISSVPCHNEVKKDESFDDDVAMLEGQLEMILKDQDVVIT